MTTQTDALKARVIDIVDELSVRLIAVSQTLHANPELAFEEYESMKLLADTAQEYGFAVERGVAGLDTAFVATAPGQGPGPTVAFVAEYDALPGLGHACGHNIIGTAALGAALAVQAVRDQTPGVIKLIGTPAEERGGGKVIMVERGVFDGVDAAMMVHPGTKTMTTRGTLASNKIEFEWFGKASHAAAAPDLGINALDACIQTFNNINALRQHLTDDVRIHGIITHGGQAPNIVPEYASAAFSVRAATSERSFETLEKVIRCAEAGALAAGATVKYQHEAHYANRIANPTLARLFGANVTALGETVVEPAHDERMGSSDMGNVSQTVPSLHPYLPIADIGVGGHTPEFAVAAASERGNHALLQSAKAMAMTAVDLMTQPELVEQMRQDFADTVDLNAPWRDKKFYS
ncbi:MAG: M20 family metallopeptidase [Caldilineaceae bacterium]|nr:M20 family metallopeptidase [Caldilineaceae bacterium]